MSDSLSYMSNLTFFHPLPYTPTHVPYILPMHLLTCPIYNLCLYPSTHRYMLSVMHGCYVLSPQWLKASSQPQLQGQGRGRGDGKGRGQKNKHKVRGGSSSKGMKSGQKASGSKGSRDKGSGVAVEERYVCVCRRDIVCYSC